VRTLEGQTLARTVILALERMAFLLAEEVDEDYAEEVASFTSFVTVAFTGEGQAARLYISVTEGFLREFTANLLGLEEDEVDVDRYGPHAMNDLANLIGGEVVVMLGGSEEDSPLCRPELYDAEQLEAELAGQEEGPLCCWLDSEGEVLRVQVVLTQVAAA